MKYILAIDQSTSATKAVLFDTTSQIVDRAIREHRQIYPQPGWVEHDAEEIWQNVLTVVGEIVNRQANRFADTIGVSITNQRETAVVFERGSGRPLCNAIVWQCRRAESICNDFRHTELEQIVHIRTGLKLDSYFTAPKLKWLNQQNPAMRQKLNRGEALIGTIDTYLLYRLTHGEIFATDHTNASRTLLFDIGQLRWDEELCAAFDVPMRSLPQVRESFEHFGETDVDGTLPRSLPICGVMGDSQASLFAQRCHRPGMAKATFGSGTSLLLNVGDRLKPSENGVVAALAWMHHGRPTYAMEGIISYSLATVSWLKNQLGLIHDPNDSEMLARAVDGNGGVYLVPAFSGLSTPYWNPAARAAIVGMTAYTRREHIVRAALEAVAYQIRDVLEMMADSCGLTPSVLHADGCPTKNTFLMQFTADITRLSVLASDVPEASAMGAAMVGKAGLGIEETESDAAMRPEARRYEPRMSVETASNYYSGWQSAVKRVL